MSAILKQAFEKFRDEGMREFLKSVAGNSGNVTKRARIEGQKIYLPIIYRGSSPDPLKTIEIRTQDIQHFLRPNFFARLGKRYGTFVVSGDWDNTLFGPEQRGLLPINKYWLYNRSKEYIQNGHCWKSVNWGDGIQQRGSSLPIKDKKHHVKKVSEIYEEIELHGYQSQRELDKGGIVPPEYDEIRVNIGRHGNMILDDGRHRFCAARIIGVKKLPVRIFVRHQKWQEIRHNIANCSSLNDLDEETRDHLDHPDIQDVI